MTSDATRAAHRQLETLFRSGSLAGLADGQLLERFADRRRWDDEAGQAAFAALVDRHGGMVLRACRRVLGDDHEAEEAAQATFLVLARRAGSIGRLESVGGWLHGVAARVAGKARVAATRRRARERRGGELAAGRMLDRQATDAADDPERWVELHQELGSLPEKFRAPLVLCYLEGFTQEQAAEALRWPLGTVQSRLARGRARLKSRLTSRGVAPAAAWLDLGPMSTAMPPAAPAAWAEATARTAVRFTIPGSEAIRAGAWPASAGLATGALRSMTMTKLKYAAATVLFAAVAAGATTLIGPKPAGSPGQDGGSRAVTPPTPLPRPTAPVPSPDRAITGVVLDDQGRPLAKAWVGSDPRPMMDTWDNPRPEDIRERLEPFRDPKGEVIPPGAVGKYFEVRDRQGGPWHAVSPDDINPWEPNAFTSEGPVSKEEVAKTQSRYQVRVEKGGWWMASLPGTSDAVRADAQGRFTAKVSANGGVGTRLHFASADYIHQAIRTLKAEDFDQPIRITLRPTRLVRARVIEVPRDDTKASIGWTASEVDAAGQGGEPWQQWFLPNVNNHDPAHVKRRLEVRLPSGRWKVAFQAETSARTVDLAVPPGEGPFDLPDITLESPTPAGPRKPATGRAAFPEPKRDVRVKGRVVGPDGRPVAGARLKPEQATVRRSGLVTDARGDFSFEAEKINLDYFYLRVEADGLASKLFRLDDNGDVREPLKLGAGALVTGRVVRDGRPVAGASVGLQQLKRHDDHFLGFPEAKADDQGRFTFEHAFADDDLIASVAIGSLKDHGAVVPLRFKTGGDGSGVDLGDFEVKPGRRLAGRVVFADGKAIPPKTRVLASVADAYGMVAGAVDPTTGRFEIPGLPGAEVHVVVQFPDNPTAWLPPGYRISPTVKCLSPLSNYLVAGRLDRDVDDLTILFEPGPEPRMTLDPGALADFNEARAGTITGAPPGSVPPAK